MRTLRRAQALVVAAVIVLTAVFAAPVWGAPRTQDNLLANPGFESGAYDPIGDGSTVPNGWKPWWETPVSGCYNFRPFYQVVSTAMAGRVHGGTYALQYFTDFSSHNAGIYQQVSVTPGTTYRFTIWGHAWSTDDLAKASSTANAKLMIGIDPQGGDNPFASSVVWSTAVAAMDTYQQFSVQATAQAAQITVYVRSRPDWCVKRNSAFWDDASLTVAGSPSTNPQPTSPPAQPTPVPAQSTRATPDPTGRIVHTVQVGDSISYLAWLYGVTIDDIKRLNNLNSNVIVLGTRLVIKEGSAPTATLSEEQGTPSAEVTESPAEATSVPAEAPAPETPGSICVMSYDDKNSNGLRDSQETLLAGITFALNDGSQMVGLYTTDGTSEPYCFTELAPGQYVVSWTADSYVPTNEQTWSVELMSGSILIREFGVKSAAGAEEASKPPTQTGGGMPTWATALVGALGVVFFLSAVGAAGYFFLIRRARI